MVLSESTMAVVMEALEHHKEWIADLDSMAFYEGAKGKEQIAAIDAAITELQAAQAGEWRPVSERFLLTHDTGLRDHPKLFIRWNADDESILVGRDDGSFYHCPLPDNIRLWQRTIGSQEGRNE